VTSVYGPYQGRSSGGTAREATAALALSEICEPASAAGRNTPSATRRWALDATTRVTPVVPEAATRAAQSKVTDMAACARRGGTWRSATVSLRHDTREATASVRQRELDGARSRRLLQGTSDASRPGVLLDRERSYGSMHHRGWMKVVISGVTCVSEHVSLDHEATRH
jgi:hypothetical protein